MYGYNYVISAIKHGWTFHVRSDEHFVFIWRKHKPGADPGFRFERGAYRERRRMGATENASPVKCNTMKMTDQIAALEFARPGK